MPPLQLTQVEYEYQGSVAELIEGDEVKLLPMLKMLESEIGGERKPYGLRFHAIDLLTYLEIVVSFIAGASVTTIVSKYLEGLINADAIKKLGEKHRQQIENWYSKLETDIKRIVQAFAHASKVIVVPTFQNKPMAVAMRIDCCSGSLYIVLNHEAVSPKLILSLPKGVVKALHYLTESSIPSDAHTFQLYFDKASHSWRYLFMPTQKAFGQWIDRYVDLDTKQVLSIVSQKEFIEKFQPATQDEFKFLISPFREKK